MKLRIDAKELLEQVLNEVEPDEDVDEAILRTCKRRYPDQFMEVFPALLQVIDLVGENVDGSGVDLIRSLVESDDTMTINLSSSDVVETQAIDRDSGEILKDLPPGLRTRFGKALTAGDGDHTIEKTVIRRTSASGREMLDCRCGFLGPAEDARCPKCGIRVSD
ncbi:hypothetical protein ACFL3H_06275 [Gemmatimonadota bacterium]